MPPKMLIAVMINPATASPRTNFEAPSIAPKNELEEESSFFGAMDGASKFVRGDAVAGLIITAINIFGGIVIGVTHHGLTLARSADVYTKLSVGDGLVRWE